MVSEVLYGARREDKRVVESEVGETLWCSCHDVLERPVTVVAVAIVLRSEAVYINKHAQNVTIPRRYNIFV